MSQLTKYKQPEKNSTSIQRLMACGRSVNNYDLGQPPAMVVAFSFLFIATITQVFIADCESRKLLIMDTNYSDTVDYFFCNLFAGVRTDFGPATD